MCVWEKREKRERTHTNSFRKLNPERHFRLVLSSPARKKRSNIPLLPTTATTLQQPNSVGHWESTTTRQQQQQQQCRTHLRNLWFANSSSRVKERDRRSTAPFKVRMQMAVERNKKKKRRALTASSLVYFVAHLTHTQTFFFFWLFKIFFFFFILRRCRHRCGHQETLGDIRRRRRRRSFSLLSRVQNTRAINRRPRGKKKGAAGPKESFFQEEKVSATTQKSLLMTPHIHIHTHTNVRSSAWQQYVVKSSKRKRRKKNLFFFSPSLLLPCPALSCPRMRWLLLRHWHRVRKEGREDWTGLDSSDDVAIPKRTDPLASCRFSFVRSFVCWKTAAAAATAKTTTTTMTLCHRLVTRANQKRGKVGTCCNHDPPPLSLSLSLSLSPFLPSFSSSTVYHFVPNVKSN